MARELIIQDSCDLISELIEDLKKHTQERNNQLTIVFTAVEKQDRITVEKALKGEFPKEGTVLKDITADAINETTTVKKEPKWSDVSSGTSTPPSVAQDPKDKKKEMPPPTMVPLRKKKIKQEPSANEPIRKSARTKGKTKITDTSDKSYDRPSDIVIQEQPVPTVDLIETDQLVNSDKSDDRSSAKTTRSTRSKAAKKKPNTVPAVNHEKDTAPEEEETEKPVRSTRTKTLRKNQKRSVSKSPEKTSTAEVSKKLKMSSSPQKKPEEQTKRPEVTKDTQDLGKTFNKEPEESGGRTFCLEPGSEPQLNGTMVVDNPLIVKDGSTAANVAAAMSNKTPNRQKDKVNGDVFSPVKSKVNAFEELIKKQNNSSSKVTTPISRLPVTKSCSTSKQLKYLPASSGNLSSANTAQTNSAMKASLAEMKERQRLKQEREQEALRKKEALLQAQMEERRRKREEKQLKAQQQREQLERERSRTRLDQVSKIEEKTKKIIAVKEEKQQQYKEQQEKRRQNAKERHGHVPSYFKTPLPLLPSDSPYDSDDERYQRPVLPIWSKDQRMLLTLCYVPEKFKNTFFCRKIHTPDLVELFETVDPKRMKRTSSAIWDKAPMYSLLHVTQDINDTSDPS
ncbi:unnamed protein product [Callosobruchus maculatus]|uniref:Inner centromere protein ARK-binding domain-containing protein n=1 Tax=Callosobruchus maculatus TaxID=64391 RepID=A0A653C3K9_CALMS|nr:unnamed protein product [Callosobruchus maculatus]